MFFEFFLDAIFVDFYQPVHQKWHPKQPGESSEKVEFRDLSLFRAYSKTRRFWHVLWIVIWVLRDPSWRVKLNLLASKLQAWMPKWAPRPPQTCLELPRPIQNIRFWIPKTKYAEKTNHSYQREFWKRVLKERSRVLRPSFPREFAKIVFKGRFPRDSPSLPPTSLLDSADGIDMFWIVVYLCVGVL